MRLLMLLANTGLVDTPEAPEEEDIVGYSDALPLPSFYAGTTHCNPGDSLYTKVEAAHALSGVQRVLVHPGTYNDRVIGYPDVHIIGTSANPADTIVESVGSTSGGRWSPLNGTPGLVAGITWRLISSTGGGSGQYAFHHTAVGDEIFEKCVFVSDDVTRNTAAGADMSPGARSYFIDCTFDQSASLSAEAINFHGTTAGAPIQVVFANCTANGMVKYGDLGTGDADHFYWVGTAPYWNGSGVNVTMHLGSGVGPEIGAPFTGTVIYSNALPTMPYHGVV